MGSRSFFDSVAMGLDEGADCAIGLAVKHQLVDIVEFVFNIIGKKQQVGVGGRDQIVLEIVGIYMIADDGDGDSDEQRKSKCDDNDLVAYGEMFF